MPGKGTDALHPEIWEIIFQHLRNPVPLPLSRPPRSELRQPHLTAIIRVCSLFHSLCTPILYKVAVTDDLPLFLRDFDTPSRRTSLALTERIYIEYGEEWFSHTSGEEPFDSGPKDAVGSADEEARYVTALSAVIQADPQRVFPRLRTSAVCSIYNSKASSWDDTDLLKKLRFRLVDPAIILSGDLWEEILSKCQVRHCWFHSTGGPLLPRYPCPPNLPDHIRIPPMTIHSTYDLDLLVVRPNTSVRWVIDSSWHTDWLETAMQLGSGLAYTLNKFYGIPVSPSALHDLDIDIFYSTSNLGLHCEGVEEVDRIVSPYLNEVAHRRTEEPPEADDRLSLETQRLFAAEMSSDIERRLREEGISDVALRWHASADTPICEACGKGPV